MNNNNIDKIIHKIVRDKIKCYFISPHFDDAILSCGNLIEYLAKKTKVEIINVFTKADTRYLTPSAYRFLKMSGYKNAIDFFNERKIEDSNIFNNFGVNSYCLGYDDALWRKKNYTNPIMRFIHNILPIIGNIYPVYSHVIAGNISDFDKVNESNIKKDIFSIVDHDKNYLAFFPSGIGRHVDHLILKKIALEFEPKTIFYADYPYRLTNWLDKNDAQPIYVTHKFKGNNVKAVLIRKYKTQYKCLFPNGIPSDTEDIYFLNNKVF